MEEMKNTTRPARKSYGWQELAMLYCPGISADAATKHLRSWIAINPDLRRDLQQAGWKKGNRLLSPRQVEIMFYYLGEP